MATLSGNKIKDTYQSLIKLTDNGNLTTGAKQLTDGFGNNSPLYISTTQIGIGVTPEATYDLHVYSNAKVGGNLTVTGDLTVEGTTTTIDTQTLTVEDPLIEVASNNTSTDAVDIGWYGKYAPSGTTLYAGLFRDTGDSKFKLFRNLEEQPTTTVNTSGTGYTRADLIIGGLEATTGDFTDTVTVDGDIEVENSSGFGRIEIGGSSGAYIDLKSPFSDDFDLRLYTAGTNAQINAINGELDITAYTNINLQYQGTDVLVMSSTGVAVTGTGSFTGQVTIPETPSANTDAASKGYVDSQITAQDLDFSGDSGTGAVDLDSQTLSITGGTLITTTALNQNLDIDHNSVSRTDTTSSASPAFGGTFTAVDSVTSSTEGHITAINLKTVTVPTPTYPTVNNNTITINAGSNLDTGGAFTLNQSFDETITIDLATTITGLTSVSSTTFSGQLDGTISSTTTATTQTQGDNSTKVATTAYVDSAIGGQDTLAEILANGNTTGGTDISVSSGDDITFTDTSKAIFNSALEIYHDGSNSFIDESGTGDLFIRSTNGDGVYIYAGGTGSSNKRVFANSTGSVDLYYGSTKRFETTSTGVETTGGIVVDGTTGAFANSGITLKRTGILTGDADILLAGTSGSEALAFRINDSEKVRIDNSGQVGIGTSSPSEKLHVYKSTGNSFGLIQSAASGVAGLKLQSSAGLSTIYSGVGSAQGFQFYADGASEAMRIDTSGRVGIGTTSPNSFGFLEKAVHINAGTSSSTTLQQAGLVISGSSDSDDADDFGYVSFLNNHSALSNDRVAEIRITKNGTDVDTGQFTFYTANGTSLTQALMLDSSQKATFYGNIDINGNNKHIRFIDTYGNWMIEAGDGANNFKIHSQSLAADYLTLEGGGQLNLGEYGSGSFTGTATYRLAVDSSGDVIEIPIGGGAVDGSGTANTVTMWSDTDTITDAPITISGNNSTFAGSVTSPNFIVSDGTDNYIQFDLNGKNSHFTNQSKSFIWSGQGASGDYLAGTLNFQSRSSADRDINFITGATPAKRLTISGSGNVGIGTASPSGKLHVHGGDASIYSIFARSDSKWMYLHSGGTDPAIGWDTGGAMRFGTATSNVGAAFSEKMRIDTSGNVGIGTTTPNYLLDVEKSGANVRIYDTTGNTTLNLTSSNTANNNIEFGDTEDANVGQIIYRHASNSMSFTTNASEAMRIDSSGRVGIGTTSPQAKLDIVNSGLSTQLRLSNTTSDATTKYGVITGRHYTNSEENVTGMLITSSSSVIGGSVSIGGGVSAANAVNEIKFYTAANNTTLTGTERMRIDSSGNVGIGTTSPNAKLKIEGNSATNGLSIKSAGNGGTYPFMVTWSGGTEGDAFCVDDNLNVGIGTNNPQVPLQIGTHLTTAPTDTGLCVSNRKSIRINDSDGSYNFGVYIKQNYSGSSYLILGTRHNGTDTDGLVVKNGQVGIGTSSPSAKLDVRKSGTTAAQGDTDLFVGDSGAAASTAQVQILGGASGYSNLYFSDTSAYNVGGFIYNHSSNYLATNVNGSERMRIDSSGNTTFTGTISAVGASTFTLNDGVFIKAVNGTSNIASTNVWGYGLYEGSSKIGEISLVRDGTNSQMYIGTTTANQILTIGSANKVTAITIDASQNVGIGTTSPSTGLHLYRPNSGDMGSVLTLGNNGCCVANRTGVGFKDGSYYRSGIVFETSSTDGYAGHIIFKKSSNSTTLDGTTETMRISSSGNVGIGTTSPGALLEINGVDDSGATDLLRLEFDNSPADTGITFTNLYGAVKNRITMESNNTDKLMISAAHSIEFSTNTTSSNTNQRLAISNSGKVGIGTTNPTYTFHVASSNNVSIFEDTSGSSGAAFCLFNAPSNFAMGSITRNGSATSVLYNTSSDYRLKEDLQDFNALDLVDNITAYDYKWKDTEQRDYGFVAHELQEVMPNVVSGEKDGEEMQKVDYSKLTPVLLKAIQELKQEIETLKAQINN